MGENPYSIYLHRNKENKKVYIGATRQKPERRFQNGYGYMAFKDFWADIKKCGWNNFEHEILESGLSREEASEKEEYYVKKYNSTNPKYGYNTIVGGFNPKRPDVSEMMKKRKGVNNPHFGKAAHPNTKIALLEYAKNQPLGADNPCAIPAIQFTKSGEFVARYGCILDAQKTLGKKFSHISECCKGKRKSSNGYIWRYERSEDLSELQC